MRLPVQTNMLRTIVIIAAATSAMGIELTPDTWDTTTAGKTVFVKFFAPWCGHCKAMKPTWDTLMSEYEGSATVLVADVDCIGSGKDLCSKVGVKGFPTIKYGDPDNLEDYKGGRDAKSLQKFASELKPSCDVDTLENCSDEQKSTIETLNSQTEEYLKTQVEKEAAERKAAETLFETSVQKLQTEYQEFVSQKEISVTEISKKYNVGLVQSILQNKKSKKDEL